MKWLVLIVVAIAALIVAVVVIGALLPKDHTVTRAIRLKQPPAAVWQAITDYTKFPEWRHDVERVEPLPASFSAGGTKSGWVETVKGAGRIPLEITQSVPPQRLVTHIADPNLPFGGDWIYEITPAADGAGCRLRITENGSVGNPIFRFVSRFVFGLHATMDNYLKALASKFGESATLED
jgi:uncharacterized protein YndB with AHSA1/START domain